MPRDHTDRPLSFKIEVLRRLERGEKVAALSSELNVRDSTIRGWRQHKVKLFAQMEKGINLSTKHDRESNNPAVDRALITWLKDLITRPNPPRIDTKTFQLKAEL